MNLVNDKVQVWANRVLKKLCTQLNYPQEAQKQPIAVSFKSISSIVLSQLAEMEEYGGKNDAGVMTAMDFMNDFATEEFLTKNIRVRP